MEARLPLIIAKTIQIVEGQMRAQRGLVAKRMMDNMNLPAAAYPLSAALTDLEDYYLVGTFNSGLIKALGESGEGARAAGELKGNAVFISAGSFIASEDTSRVIRAFLAPGSQRAARVKALQACLNSFTDADAKDVLGRPLNINGIDRGQEFIALRRRVIQCARSNGQPI